MKKIKETLYLSATDLSHYMACKHLTTLDQSGALGILQIPAVRDASLTALQDRGFELETEYLSSLEKQGLSISHPGEDEDHQTAFDRTSKAMRAGLDIIYQASLKLNNWQGR